MRAHQTIIDDCAVIDAVAAVQPDASGSTILNWLKQNRRRPWWQFRPWSLAAIYGCLARLESLRLIDSGWERSAGPEGLRRRLYWVRRP